MTRRALSRVLVSLGLLFGTLAWTGLTLQRTVFDSTRSERVVNVLLENDQVQAVLRQQLLRATDAALPENVRSQVPTEELAAAATAALDDPRVQTAVRQALVDSHRYVIGEMDEPPTLDTVLIDSVLRQQIGAVSPTLAGLLPVLEPVRVELPSAGLSPVAKVRSLAVTLTPLLAFAALCLVLAGLLMTPSKPKVLRRVGYWGVSLGAVWVFLGFFLPALAERLLGDNGVIVAALTEAVSESMALPGAVLLGGGLAILALASLVGAMERDLTAANRRAQRARDQARQQARQEARQQARDAKATRAAAKGARKAKPGAAVSAASHAGDGGGAADYGYQGNEAAVWSPSGPVDDAGLYAPPQHAYAPPQHAYAATDPTTVLPQAGWHPGSPAPEPAAAAAVKSSGYTPRPTPTVSPEAAALAIPLPKRPRRDANPTVAAPNDERLETEGHTPNEWLGGFPMHPGAHPRIADPAPSPPRWVEGVGYVYDQAPDPSARWVDGLGYVMEQD